MNPFQLSFNIPEYPVKIKHGDPLIFIGSCFSDEIAFKARQVGWKTLSNPFGTIFHPIILSDFISECLTDHHEERIIQRNDLFLSWDASSLVYALSESDLEERLKVIRRELRVELSSAKFLFVTFGTAWGYEHRDSRQLVANCHKFPSDTFTKKLTESSIIIEEWKKTIEKIKNINPEIEIVFTVSPVRHSKDGLIENNRSKAVLIESIRMLESQTKISYFPSYEIVIDELRDYRFFEKDMVHPSEQAVDYVWSRFIDCYCIEETKKINDRVVKYRLMKNHRTLFPDSKEYQQHLVRTEKLRSDLLTQVPNIFLD